MPHTRTPGLPWTMDTIPYEKVDVSLTADREALFYIVATASFIETISDVTTRNLISFFSDDAEVSDWLACHWEPEELQHGRALRAYVLAAWPDFDWDTAYAGFAEEYGAVCTVDEFEASRALELAARCVVETGTATYYGALQNMAREPVLHELAGRIRADEIRHYKHFLQYYHRYCGHERLGRWPVFQAVRRRLVEVRSDDADISFWHAFRMRHPGLERRGARFMAEFDGVSATVRAHLSTSTAIKMLMKPLRLPPALSRWLNPPLALLTERFILR